MLKQRKYTIFDMVVLPFQASKAMVILLSVYRIISGLLPSLTILATARFVDTALEIFNGTADKNSIYPPLFIILGIGLYSYTSKILIRFAHMRMSLRLAETYLYSLVDKMSRLDYSHIENSESQELINRVCKKGDIKVMFGFGDLYQIFDLVLSTSAILVVLVTQVWWAALIILAFSVPLIYVAVKAGKATYEQNKEAAKHERRAEYLSSVLTGRENVEERNIFGYTAEINKKWAEKFEAARKIRFNAELKQMVRIKASGLVMVLVSVLIAGTLAFPLSAGLITVGIFIGLCSSTFSTVNDFSWAIPYYMSRLAEMSEYMKDLTAYAALSEAEGATDLPILVPDARQDPIEFKNVSFQYPGTDKYILKNLSMKLEPGKKYAFVGVNGAGKTTITKILTGLYDNYKGEIAIGEKSLRKYSAAEKKWLFSVVYQDFAKYAVSLRENFALGRDFTEEAMQEAIKTLELDGVLEKLPNGLDTPLGKAREGGVDLSGGEWQRIAIARTLLHNAPFTILDEPTAALDPVAECKVYEAFGAASKGKSTIFITHRLGAARLADEILVVDGGKIAEKGSHDELMNAKGIYSRMFEEQRSWYN